MNRTVIIDDCNLRDTFDVVMTSKQISNAEIKSETIDVPCSNGTIDLSQALTGDVVYENRKIKIELEKLEPTGNLLSFQSKFDNKFNGKYVKVVFEEDPDYYWVGRCSVEHDIDKVIDSITIEIDAYPFKYKKNKTVVTETIETSKTIVCSNLRKWVTPSFKASSDMDILFESNHYSIGTTAKLLPGLIFKQGDNTLEVTGNGTIEITYQEEGL